MTIHIQKILAGAIVIGAFVLFLIWCLFGTIGCSSASAVAQSSPTLIRVQSDCRDGNYWTNPQGQVRLTYIDGQSHKSISYLFTCDMQSGLLTNPVFETIQ